MTLLSCLYVGNVMHRRLRPIPHRFRYRAFWMLIDLDEVPSVDTRLRLFSHNHFNLFTLRDADHGDGSNTPLRTQMEQNLSRAGIDIADGRIRLFCMPRTLGYNFNPLSIYFCYRPSGQLAAIIYQVHNTFGERHAYVAPVDIRADTPIRHNCDKTFFVSPFLDMDMRYSFRLNEPAQRFILTIGAASRDQIVLSAGLLACRRPLTDLTLLQAFLAIPLATAKVTLTIYWEALRLWFKGMRLRVRPQPPAHNFTLAISPATQRIDSDAP